MRGPVQIVRALLVGGVCLIAALAHAKPKPALEPEPWPTVPPQFADAAAVVLEDFGAWVWQSAEKAKLHRKRRILIRTEAAFDFADREIVYDNKQEKIADFAAKTIFPDGREIPVPQSLIHKAVLAKTADFDYRVVQFTFPAVREDVILEWKYTREQWDPSPFETWQVQHSVPVLHSYFGLTLMDPMGPYVNIRANSRSDPNQRCLREIEAGQTKTLHLTCKNIASYEDESWAPPDRDTWLTYDFDWGSLVEPVAETIWSYKHKFWLGRVKKFVSKSKQVRQIAQDSIPSGDTTVETIDHVNRFVADRIERVETDELLVARNVDELLDLGQGNTIEITLLTLALLRAKGLETEALLANDRSEQKFVQEMNGYTQANHLMLRVEDDDGYTFVDPTCRFCSPGIPDWRFSSIERTAVLLHKDGPKFIAVGEVPAERNSYVQRETRRIDKSGEATIEGQAAFGGQLEVARRRRWDPLSETGRREDFLDDFQLGSETAELVFSDLEDRFEPLTVDYKIGGVEVPRTHDNRLLLQPGHTLSGGLQFPLQEDRSHQIWLPFRQTKRYEIEFHLPEGFVVVAPPAPKAIPGPGMSFEEHWEHEEGTTMIRWVATLTLNRTLLGLSDYPPLKRFYLRVRSALRRGAVAVPQDPNVAETADAAN